MFAAYMVGISALADIVYDDEVLPAFLGWPVIALYLAAAFITGLLTPLKTATLAPVIAYVTVALLWPLTPWNSYDNLTYDSGWPGAVVYKAVIPSLLVWCVAYAGRKFGGPVEEGA